MSQAPVPCLRHSVLEQGQVGQPRTTANLREEGLDLSTRVLSAYYTPVTIGEASTTESKSVLGDTFLPAYNKNT